MTGKVSALLLYPQVTEIKQCMYIGLQQQAVVHPIGVVTSVRNDMSRLKHFKDAAAGNGTAAFNARCKAPCSRQFYVVAHDPNGGPARSC